MIYRALLRSGPKYLISAIVAVGSVTGFCLWWFLRKSATSENHPAPPPAIVDNSAKLALIESKPERLLLVDNDLYDLDTGDVIFKSWLQDRMPAKLFWEPDSKTMLAQYERGFVRYKLDGKEVAAIPEKYLFGIADDYQWIVFSRDKDIWRAEMDWKELKFANERKVTSIGQFNDQNFAGNIMLGTQKTLVVRNAMNQILRVNLGTGDVHPTKIPLLEIGKRRSPDSKSVVGIQNGQFYCYDVDTDTADTMTIGRGAITDYQWLDNDRCVVIAGGTHVGVYDRKNKTLNEVVALPGQYPKVGEPSPDGRFVFCYRSKGGVLVDLEKKTATPIQGGAGISWVSNDTFVLSREVPDSDLRGTWLEKAGEAERRVSPEPYLVSKAGGTIIPLTSADVVVFATKQGLSKMKPDGSDVAEVVKLTHAPERVLGIQNWQQ